MTTPQRPDHLDELLRELYRIRSVHRELSGGSTLHIQGFMLLGVLKANGPMRASVMADYFGIDVSVMSRHITSYVESGYIAKTADPEDGRAQILSLTDTGLETLKIAHAQRAERLAAATESWSDEQLTDLVSGLASLRTAVMEPEEEL